MALNWAMVDSSGERPVPLPEEKIFLAIEKCQMSLEYKEQKATWEAKGSAFVTNQRVVFLRQPPLPQPADQSQASQHLRSLNLPLSHLVDCRYMIPVLAAPYYEASVISVPGGNLPEAQPGGPTVKGQLKIWFSEGGGSAFRDAVEEVRNLSKSGRHGEQLPAYQPSRPDTPGSRSVAPSVAATADSSIGARTAIGVNEYSSSDRSSSIRASTRPQSRTSHVAPEDLEAARVAMAQEEQEREAIRQEAERTAEPSSSGGVVTANSNNPPPIDEGGPPAYDAVGAVTTFVPSSAQTDEAAMDTTDHDHRPSQHQVSARERAQRRAKIRARRMRVAAAKVMGSFEGRDRVVQLVHGLALLTHHSFGSVRSPRSFGLFPVPHVLFFLFSRRLRRDTLANVHLFGEVVDKWRKLLLFLAWCAQAGLHLQQRMGKGESNRKGKADSVEAPDSYAHKEDLDHPTLGGWYSRLADAGEVMMACCDAAEVAAVIGGSSLVWRVARAGYATRGQKALNHRQRQGLERAAFGFATVGLFLQLYVSFVYRRRARRCLGRTHRQVLLLTDDLADVQQDHDEVTETQTIPGLHSTQELHRASKHPELARVEASLRNTEAHFQALRLGMNQASLDIVTYGCEFVFAAYEALLPWREKESVEAWSEVGAGLAGIWRVFYD